MFKMEERQFLFEGKNSTVPNYTSPRPPHPPSFQGKKKMLINKQVGVCLAGCFSYSAEKINYSHSSGQHLEGNSQYIKGRRLFICLGSRILF